MEIETLKKAEDFKQGHLNLVQYFSKKGYDFKVLDKYDTDTILLDWSSDYEDIKKVINDQETLLVIRDKDGYKISTIDIVPFETGIDTIADYLCSDEVDEWSKNFEKTMEEIGIHI